MKHLLEEIDSAILVEQSGPEVIDITPTSQKFRTAMDNFSDSLGGFIVRRVVKMLIAYLVGRLVRRLFDQWDVSLTKKQKERLIDVTKTALKNEVGQRLDGPPDDTEFNVKGGGVQVMFFWRVYQEEVTNKIERELKAMLGSGSGIIRKLRLNSKVSKALKLAVKKSEKEIIDMIKTEHDKIMRSEAAKAAREEGRDITEDELSATRGNVYVNEGKRDLEITYQGVYRF